MSIINTSELTRRLTRALGIKEAFGYGLVEAVQPVVVVGNIAGPGQRDLYDVRFYADIAQSVAAASSYQFLVQNNGDDFAEIDFLDVRNGTPDVRGLTIGVVYTEPAVAWFPTTCPELAPTTTVGTTGFVRIRETSGLGISATVNGIFYVTDIVAGERFRLEVPLVLPPRASLSVFIGSGPGTGAHLVNVSGTIPMQAA